MIYINVWIRCFGALQNVGVHHPPFFECIVHLFEPFGEFEGLYDLNKWRYQIDTKSEKFCLDVNSGINVNAKATLERHF